MSGTKAGGKQAAITNKSQHGEDFYQRIGAKGGRNSHTGGFYANRELASRAGTIGGRNSRRGQWTKAQKKQAAITRAHNDFQRGLTNDEEPKQKSNWANKLISKWGNK